MCRPHCEEGTQSPLQPLSGLEREWGGWGWAERGTGLIHPPPSPTPVPLTWGAWWVLLTPALEESGRAQGHCHWPGAGVAGHRSGLLGVSSLAVCRSETRTGQVTPPASGRSKHMVLVQRAEIPVQPEALGLATSFKSCASSIPSYGPIEQRANLSSSTALCYVFRIFLAHQHSQGASANWIVHRQCPGSQGPAGSRH